MIIVRNDLQVQQGYGMGTLGGWWHWLLNVELVPFGIDQVDEVLAAYVPGLKLVRPEDDEALDLSIDPPAAFVVGSRGFRASHVEVKVNAVLDNLLFRHPLEVDPRTRPVRVDHGVR